MVKSDNKFGKTPVQLVLDDIIKIIKSFYSRVCVCVCVCVCKNQISPDPAPILSFRTATMKINV
jgi:hypothetical protein